MSQISLCLCDSYTKTWKVQHFNIDQWSSDKLLTALVRTDYYYNSNRLKILNFLWLSSK